MTLPRLSRTLPAGLSLAATTLAGFGVPPVAAQTNLTFENDAEPKGQALAIRLDGDRAVFRQCRFLGWQDTVLANRGRQYFTNCFIAGHVDFIFGAATCVFDHCHIHCLRDGYITAASTPAEEPFGFVFLNCRLSGEKPEVRTYLGRPWRLHASTLFLDTEMSAVVRPEGWNNWKKPEAEQITVSKVLGGSDSWNPQGH